MSSTFGNSGPPLSGPRWFIPFRSEGPVTHRLFCFPHSGAGASLFASWPKLLPPSVQVCGVQLPGREDRLRERPLTDVPAVVMALSTALQPWLEIPFTFFGHSLGAVLAYELALHLQTRKAPVPTRVFVSARLPPCVASPLAPIATLPDADFLRELRRRYGRSSEAFWSNRELVDLYLPILRADLRLAESPLFTKHGRLECPIAAFGGIDDEIPPAQLREWQKHTASDFQLRMLPGDHGFITSAREQLVDEIARSLFGSQPTSAS